MPKQYFTQREKLSMQTELMYLRDKIQLMTRQDITNHLKEKTGVEIKYCTLMKWIKVFELPKPKEKVKERRKKESLPKPIRQTYGHKSVCLLQKQIRCLAVAFKEIHDDFITGNLHPAISAIIDNNKSYFEEK